MEFIIETNYVGSLGSIGIF